MTNERIIPFYYNLGTIYTERERICVNRQLQSTNRQFGNKLTVSLCLHFQLKKKKSVASLDFFIYLFYFY